MKNLDSCLEYIEKFWDQATVHITEDQETLIGLPKPYVRANCNMFNEMYYWDSYFIAEGLAITKHKQLVVDTAENHAHLVNRFGKIPNANRFYFLSRSQPPFFSEVIRLALDVLQADDTADWKEWLKGMYDAANKEYSTVWMSNSFPDERCVYRGLSRYYDLNYWHNAAEAESGWDMSSRFEEKCLDWLPIDLNCILLRYEKNMARFADLLGLDEEQAWIDRANLRSATMQELLWNEEVSFFVDFDYPNERRSELVTLAGMFALWANLATQEQADRIVETMIRELETDHGLLTTEERATKREFPLGQWDYPNGWAPLHLITVTGLLNYGFDKQAKRIATKWNNLVAANFDDTGTIHEKYDVVDGTQASSERYEHQEGFGWTNATFLRFLELLKA